MPINTDQIDLSQPLAGQDVKTAASPPIENPVIDPARVKGMAERFKQLMGGGDEPKIAQPSQNVAPEKTAEPPAKPAPPPPAAKTPQEPPKPPDQPKTQAPPEKPQEGGKALESEPSLDPNTYHSPKTREAFQNLVRQSNSYKSQADDLKKKNEELLARLTPMEQELTKIKAEVPPDLETVRTAAAKVQELEKTNADLLQRIETLNLEHSPRFQNWWKSETEKHLKIAQRNVPADKREELGKLLMEPPSTERDTAIDAILEPLSNTAKRLVNGAVEQLEMVKIQREDALSQGSERYKELVAHEQAERQKTAEATKAIKDRVTTKALARARNLNAFKPIEGDVDHNNEIPVREDFIKAMINGELDEDTMVSIPGLAFEALHLRDKVVPQLRAELEKANNLVKQLQSASPAPTTGQTPSKPAETKAGAKGGFYEAFKGAMGR